MSGFADFAIAAAQDKEQWIQNKEAGYETSVVKYLLKMFDIQTRRHELEQACEEASGRRRLSMAWFHAAYPSFPIRLGAKRIPDVSRSPIYQLHDVYERDGKLKDKFFSSPIFKAYESFLEDYSSECDTVGMVFPCRQVVHYILHNGVARIDLPGSRLCKTTSPGSQIYVLEPLRQYLGELTDRWRPGV